MGNCIENHGGNIYNAAKLYGMKKEDILDYSANINPLGLPPGLKGLLVGEIDNLVNYPDPWCSTLRERIAEYVDITTDSVIVGNGASEVILLLLEMLKPKKVLIPAPSFSEYARAAYRSGIGVEYLPMKEENGFMPDLPEIKKRLDNCSCDAVFICNPNNPTSVLLNISELTSLVEFASVKGANIIIDEAFIELTPGGNSNSMVRAVKEYPNLFIVRAFTKLFAIPGLRLGYGIGNSRLVKGMWETKLPWSVNSFACSMGELLSGEKEYLMETARWIEVELKWFYNELSAIPGLKVFEPSTNFVLVKLEGFSLDSGELCEKMAKRGILLRDASNFAFLDKRFFRAAVKDRQNNLRFLKVLKEVLGV